MLPGTGSDPRGEALSGQIAVPARLRGWSITHVVITTLLAAALPVAFALLAPASAKVWGGVVLLGLLGYAAIRSGWAWLLPLVGAVALLPIVVDLSAWQPAYGWASVALSALTAVLVIAMTLRGWRRRLTTVTMAAPVVAPMALPATAGPAPASAPAAPDLSFATTVMPTAAAASPAVGSPAMLQVQAQPMADIPIVVSVAGTVTITWAAPRESGGAPVTDFAVEMSRDAGVTWSAVRREPSVACSAVIDGLEFGVPHAFRVAAINIAGRGAFSAATSPIIPIGTPGAPHSIVCTPGDRRVQLDWQAPSDNGGSSVVGYAVEVSGDGGSTWVRVKGGPVREPVAHVPNLANGTTYAFRVRAINAAGEGAVSESSSPSTPAGPPSAPGAITVVPQVGGLDLSWTAPAKDGGLPIIGYQVDLSADGGVTWHPEARPALCQVSLTGLVPTVAYLVRVSASNGVSLGVPVQSRMPASPIGVPGAVPSVVAHFPDGTTARMLTATPTPIVAQPTTTVADQPITVVGAVPPPPPAPVVWTGPTPPGSIALTTVIPQPSRSGHALRWVLGSTLVVVGLVVIVLALRATVLSDLSFQQGQSPQVAPAMSNPDGDSTDGSPVVAADPGTPPDSGIAPDVPVASGVPAASDAPAAPVSPSAAAPRVPLGTVVGSIAFQRGEQTLVFDDPLVVHQGVGDDQLALGPGHYPKTVMPGEMGNAAIAGHRTGWGSPFLHLDDLRVGDQVLFTDEAGTLFHFTVHTTVIVRPDEVWVLGPDPVSVGAPTLTLTTCDPPHVNSKRLVVFAVLDPQT